MSAFSEHLTALYLLQCAFTLAAGLDCSVQTPGRGVWIESSRILNKGRANRLTAVFCTYDPVWIQIWIKSGAQWMPVWSKYWQPTSVGVSDYLNLQLEEYIDIGPEHRLGLAPVDQDKLQISVRKLFDSALVQLLSSDEVGPYQINKAYSFGDLKYPGTFQVDFCNSDGCPELDLPVEAPTPSVTPVPCQVWAADGKVKLETHRLLPRGQIKAIRTRFCEINPVNVQIWDSVQDQPEKYQLVWQKTVYPVLGNGQEITIPLKPEEVIAVQSSYRLGLQSGDVTSNISVPYRFSADGAANIVRSTSTSVSLCDEMLFEDIPYPLEFVMSFCYDIVSGTCSSITHTACNQTAPDTEDSNTVLCPTKRSVTTESVSEGPDVAGAEGVSASAAKSSWHQSTVYTVLALTAVIACY